MKDELEKVKQFQIATDQPRVLISEEPSADTVRLRLKIITEELLELAQALSTKEFDAVDYVQKVAVIEGDKLQSLYAKALTTTISKVETLDALADLKYVLDGTVVSFGMEVIFEDVFEEVHRSNMTKFCRNGEHAEHEKMLQALAGVDVYITEITPSVHVLKRVSDNKVVKPSTYSPAGIGAIFKRYLESLAQPKLGL